MVKTYKNKDGIIFKGIQYTGKNYEEFYKELNDDRGKMGLPLRVGMPTIVIEDSQGIAFSLYGKSIELRKGNHFLYSQESGLFGVFNNAELKEELKQVK